MPLTCGPLDTSGGISDEWPDEVDWEIEALNFPIELLFLAAFADDDDDRMGTEDLSLMREMRGGECSRRTAPSGRPDCETVRLVRLRSSWRYLPRLPPWLLHESRIEQLSF